MRVVVTGGAGFIGANLCRALAADETITEVVALDDLSTGSSANLEGVDGVELVVGSILDPALMAKVISGSQAVVHLAARPSVARSMADPVTTHEVNATGTLRVLETARTNGRPYLVIASSSSVYGANPTLPKSEDLLPAPMSPYAASKLAAEAYAGAYARGFGMDILTFRFFNVFGPFQSAGHDYAAVVPAFLSAALAGRPLQIYGDGEQSRDFTYVGSVAEVLRAAIAGRVTHPGPVNLAFGTRTTLLDLIVLLEELLGRRVERKHLGRRVGDVRHSQADTELLSSLFPNTTPVALADALGQTLDWVRSTSSIS